MATAPGNGTSADWRIMFGLSLAARDHAFRHTDAIGLDRDAVAAAIVKDLTGPPPSRRSPFAALIRGSVLVDGTRLDYHAFPVSDEIVNVGRITPHRSQAR